MALTAREAAVGPSAEANVEKRADEGLPAGIRERVGKTLRQKYTLERILGVGGMASVYRARHRNGNRVAVKILHTELSASKEIRERFLREGYVANHVDHDGAVRVLDDDIAEDGAPFLVMELLDGMTLEDHILAKGGTLAAHEVVPMACQLLEVLAAAHAKGIVHRDIKPENLFITKRDGVLKVLDFGIARLTDGARQATRTGRVMGTPVYMAPEQARGETKLIDGQTDLWAAAATVYRALSGGFVHDAETPELVLVRAATQPAPPLRSIVPSIELELAEIIDRGLAWKKGERWPSARAMLTALRSLALDDLSHVSAKAPLPRTVDMTQPLAAPVAPAGRPAVGATASPTQPMPGQAALLPTYDDETELAVPVPSAFGRPASPSTTAGVAREGSATSSGAKGRAPYVLVGLGVVLVLVAGITVGVFATRESKERSLTTTEPPSAHVLSTVPFVPQDSAVPSAPAPSAPAAASSAGADGGRPRGVPDAAPSPRVVPPAPVRQQASPRVPIVASGETTVVASPKAEPAATCPPRYTLDAQGSKIWTMECPKK